MGRLEGKIAVITGGSSGIGLATGERFVAEGATVYITGRRQAELDAAIDIIGDHARGVRGDISKLEDLDRLYSQIAAESGRLDIVFANAGIGALAPLDAVSEEQFDREFAINAKGTFFTVQKALPLMKKGGAIVLNASTTSVMGQESFSVYSATKAAIRSFARTWTSDLKGKGIRVNAISPGPVVTPAYEKALGKDGAQAFAQFMASQVPLGRVGTEAEIAGAVVFLASDEASYITGIELFVDGGLAQV